MPVMRDAVAVITGDIVKSGALSSSELTAAMTALETTANDIAAWPGVAGLDYERFRGDGWQLVFAGPALALRSALVMRAALRHAVPASDTRLALGIGEAERRSSPGKSSGPAFERSGRALDALTRPRLWVFGGALGARRLDWLADAVLALCDERSRAWTPRQAEVAARLLAPDAPRMATLAQEQDLSPQTVQRHFDRAGGHALLAAVEHFEAVLASS